MDEKIGIGIYQSSGNRGSVGRVSVFELRWCRWGVAWRLGPGSGGGRAAVVLYLCELLVRILCVDGRSMYLYIVFGEYQLLGAPSVQSCCTSLWISASYRVFVYGRYGKSILVGVWLSDLDLSSPSPHDVSLSHVHTISSNDSCDRLNSNHLSQFFTCLYVFHENTTHPPNNPQLFKSLTQHQLARV